MLTLHFSDIEDFKQKKAQSIIHDEILTYIHELMDNESLARGMNGFNEIIVYSNFNIQSEINEIINECREIINTELNNKNDIPLSKNQTLYVKDEYILLVDVYETTIDDGLFKVYAAEAIKGNEVPDAEGWQDVYVLYWYPSDLHWNHPSKIIKCGIKYNTNTGKFI